MVFLISWIWFQVSQLPEPHKQVNYPILVWEFHFINYTGIVSHKHQHPKPDLFQEGVDPVEIY
jgi:hypothetical protein